MDFLRLYEDKNKHILHIMSWLNKNSMFDKSIGTFKDIDLFTFLENINVFDYDNDLFYDDIYYILEYTQESILYLINNINKEIKREHKIIPISQAREFDKKTILWLSRQDGRTVKEKLKNNKIKAVKRFRNVDTYENRIFKKFLKNLVLVFEARKNIENNDYILNKIRQWLRGEDAKSINEYGNIVYNNILLHHPHYSKIFKSYKWLNKLDEKVERYQNLYPKQIINILTFSILSKIQFKTEKLVLADNLEIDLDDFKISFNEKCLPEKVEFLKYITALKEKNIDNVEINNLKILEEDILSKQLKLKCYQDRTFIIDESGEEKIFIDLFRLFPIAKVGNKIINFPITIKQKINDKIINANNTKVINLNKEVYTLPEILKTYNTDILKYFLEDLEKQFKNKQLNYIIPDYVNVFEFSSVKKSINGYFKNSRNIPKSVLVGLQYLFSKKVKRGDTLIYIQKDHRNDLFVTPILVKFDSSLNSATKGLYLERHPTKKLQETNDIINSLNYHLKDEKLSKKLLGKFLQNGIKGIKQKEIALYLDNDIIYLDNDKNCSKLKNRTEDIKKIFQNKNLFSKKIIEMKDTNEKNLSNYQKLLEFENKGVSLWKEHLPRLAMGDMLINGYFDEFILVDDDSEMINGHIQIKNPFIIPANTSKLSFPLNFGEEHINYEACITSSELPFKEDVECELKLTYSYEDETPYKLTFIPRDKTFKSLKVEWKEIKYREYKDLPIPSYPPKKTWDEFKRDPRRDKDGYSDLLDWILERLELLENIQGIPKFILDKETSRFKQNEELEGIYKYSKLDKNGLLFCFVEVDGERVFCHSSNFKDDIDIDNLQKGMKIYLNTKRYNGNLTGENITTHKLTLEEKIYQIEQSYLEKTVDERFRSRIKGLEAIKYPLLTVWNNHSLSDSDVPDNFRLKLHGYINLSVKHMFDKTIPPEFKKEIMFFLSSIHQDTPSIMTRYLIEFSKKENLMKEYYFNLGLSMGSLKLEWQQQIFNNLLELFQKNNSVQLILKIFSIASWRAENFINNFSLNQINKINENLIKDLRVAYENFSMRNLKDITIELELLLAIIRGRKKYSNLFNPSSSITKQYLKFIDDFTKFCIENDINIETRIKLEIEKDERFINTPDLLYALRVYLSGNNKTANNIKILGVNDD